jgi:hypothetical protein
MQGVANRSRPESPIWACQFQWDQFTAVCRQEHFYLEQNLVEFDTDNGLPFADPD